MKKLSRKIKIEAYRTCDAKFDGRFYVGVKTTGIYCLPSCKAKLPLLKNIIFFDTRDEAIASGFRGCKRCKSEFFPDVEPPWVAEILSLMENQINKKMNEQVLTELAGVDISTIRRYFKSHFKMTPLAYHRKLRLVNAKKLIAQGSDSLTAAYDSGFESISGFHDAFIKEFKHSPGETCK